VHKQDQMFTGHDQDGLCRSELYHKTGSATAGQSLCLWDKTALWQRAVPSSLTPPMAPPTLLLRHLLHSLRQRCCSKATTQPLRQMRLQHRMPFSTTQASIRCAGCPATAALHEGCEGATEQCRPSGVVDQCILEVLSVAPGK
jgi:hypothetical protein